MDGRNAMPKQRQLPQPNLYEIIGRKDAVISSLTLEVERLDKELADLRQEINQVRMTELFEKEKV